MIKLSRVRTAQAIPAQYRGATRRQRSRRLLDRRIAGLDPDTDVWKASKPQLRTESDGKCAYCEGKASHVAHGDVEHFRPKSEYWWLAYCYDNFLYSCQICNQTHKGSKFPRTGTRLLEPVIPASPTEAQLDALAATFGVDPLDVPSLAQFDALRAAERPGIPDPYIVDPERLFTWTADEVIEEVEIQARNNGSVAKRAFRSVDECLGLNRFELKKWRYETYFSTMTFVETLREPAISAGLRTRIENRLRRMMSVTGEFAGMVRYYVRELEGLQL